MLQEKNMRNLNMLQQNDTKFHYFTTHFEIFDNFQYSRIYSTMTVTKIGQRFYKRNVACLEACVLKVSSRLMKFD